MDLSNNNVAPVTNLCLYKNGDLAAYSGMIVIEAAIHQIGKKLKRLHLYRSCDLQFKMGAIAKHI